MPAKIKTPDGWKTIGGNGGYYTPVVTQPDANTMQLGYTPSDAGMPAVPPVTVELPGGSSDSTQNDYVTPQMFGAVGDGVTDDTTAFQDCLTSGYDVHIPKGNYLVSDTVSVSKGVKVTGCTGAVIEVTGTSLFEISTYYNAPFELRRVKINANGNRVLSVGTGEWGASALLDDVQISGAVDSCIEISGGFNVLFRRVIIAGGDAETGAILKVGMDASTAFSNMIYLDSCVITANRNTNLLECGEAYNVKAVNCTFEGFNCAVIGRATLIGCWFEAGEQCVQEGIECKIISPHFADVSNAKPTGTANSTFYPNVKSTATLVYDVPGNSILESRFRNPVNDIETLYAGKYVYGEYTHEAIYRINSDLAHFNVPINRIWAKSKTSRLVFWLNPFYGQNIGIFEMKIHYFRTQNDEVVQRSFWHGIVIDGTPIAFDTKEMPESFVSSMSYDSSQCYLTYGNDEDGMSMGWIEFNRLGINEDLEDNLFDFGASTSDYIHAVSGDIPGMTLDTEARAIKWYGSADGDKAVLRSTMHEATSGTYRFRASFTAATETTVTPRFLLRCYDASGNVISGALDGWKYLAYYTGYYVDVDDITFALPDGTVQFQIGFVFKANPAATVSVSNIKLTVTEATAE